MMSMGMSIMTHNMPVMKLDMKRVMKKESILRNMISILGNLNTMVTREVRFRPGDLEVTVAAVDLVDSREEAESDVVVRGTNLQKVTRVEVKMMTTFPVTATSVNDGDTKRLGALKILLTSGGVKLLEGLEVDLILDLEMSGEEVILLKDPSYLQLNITLRPLLLSQ